MNSIRFRALVVFVLMAMSLTTAHLWRPTAKLADTRPAVDLETMFPKRFGAWALDERMPVQLVSPDTQAALNKFYNQTLSRTYVNAKGDRMMLSVAYGGDQSDATRAHRPEVCYPGARVPDSFQPRWADRSCRAATAASPTRVSTRFACRTHQLLDYGWRPRDT